MDISVIIPSFHPQKHTLECIESLKKQTLSSGRFEVIVVLNGDRMPYEEMLSRALPDNGWLIYSPIASACTSRNIGIDEAKGNYICFIDDDDKVSPTYLEELLRCATPDTVAASNCYSLFDDETIEENAYTREYLSKAPLGVQPFYRPKKIFSIPWMKLIHKDIIGNRRFNVKFPSGQDALLMFEISDRIRYVEFTDNKAVYYWRQRKNSLHALSYSRLLSKYLRLAWAYTRLYFRSPREYCFNFYLTRVLASLHAIIVRK